MSNDIDAGNRGRVEVSGSSRNLKFFQFLGLVVFAVIVFVFACFFFKKNNSDSAPAPIVKENETLVSKQSSGSGVTNIMAQIDDNDRREKERQKEKENNDGTNAAQLVKDTMPPASNPVSMEDEYKPLPKSLRQLTGETMVEIKNDNVITEAKEKDFLQGGEYADGSVRPVMKRAYLLSAGTSLSCVLKTKIVTSYPGVTMCQLTKDIYSDNGETLLARRGAMLIGEQNKTMTQGVARVFVNWTNLKDGNINARIDALGTDSLGASGLPGWIDTHFAERFSGALMLSLVGDGLDILKSSTQRSRSDSNVTYDNTSDATKEMAKTTLENTINIPPTAYINHGTVLSVIVPRNIDFSSVYEVR